MTLTVGSIFGSRTQTRQERSLDDTNRKARGALTEPAQMTHRTNSLTTGPDFFNQDPAKGYNGTQALARASKLLRKVSDWSVSGQVHFCRIPFEHTS